MRRYTESPEFKRSLRIVMRIMFLPVSLLYALLTGNKKRNHRRKR